MSPPRPALATTQAFLEGMQPLLIIVPVIGAMWAFEARLEDRLKEQGAALKEQAARMEAKFDQEDKKFFQLLLKLGKGPAGEGPAGGGSAA